MYLKKDFFKLNKEIPVLEESKEGLLKGGFSLSCYTQREEAEDTNLNYNGTLFCNCHCGASGDVTTTEDTTTEDTTTDPDDNNISGFSMMF
ncbi:MAG: hypothetical protein ACI4TR_00015 [Bacteroidaceae bacterium]